ncbi:MAG: hypothetical protein H0X51_07425 [Parachlamydiaceae bacterium]|nr:hypothetical protein [Parachlamydiaceae bacterium]
MTREISSNPNPVTHIPGQLTESGPTKIHLGPSSLQGRDVTVLPLDNDSKASRMFKFVTIHVDSGAQPEAIEVNASSLANRLGLTTLGVVLRALFGTLDSKIKEVITKEIRTQINSLDEHSSQQDFEAAVKTLNTMPPDLKQNLLDIPFPKLRRLLDRVETLERESPSPELRQFSAELFTSYLAIDITRIILKAPLEAEHPLQPKIQSLSDEISSLQKQVQADNKDTIALEKLLQAQEQRRELRREVGNSVDQSLNKPHSELATRVTSEQYKAHTQLLTQQLAIRLSEKSDPQERLATLNAFEQLPEAIKTNMWDSFSGVAETVRIMAANTDATEDISAINRPQGSLVDLYITNLRRPAS